MYKPPKRYPYKVNYSMVDVRGKTYPLRPQYVMATDDEDAKDQIRMRYSLAKGDGLIFTRVCLDQED